jgi:hypothetical protein
MLAIRQQAPAGRGRDSQIQILLGLVIPNAGHTQIDLSISR